MIVIKSLESDTIAHKLVSPARSRISTMLHLAVVARVEATDAAGGYSYPQIRTWQNQSQMGEKSTDRASKDALSGHSQETNKG